MDRTRRLSLSLALTAVLVVVQIVFGVVAHSSGLLADAGHNVVDAGALVLSLVAVRLVLRPPSASRSYGNHRATILVALANAAVLAKPAIEAVESGRTVFVPKQWGNTFFAWMRDIQPWCISRQLWWGHRIPAWCDGEDRWYVGRSEAEVRAELPERRCQRGGSETHDVASLHGDPPRDFRGFRSPGRCCYLGAEVIR